MRSMQRYLLLTATVGMILGNRLLPVAVAQPPAERGTVSGVVLDADTETLIPNATVRLTPLAAEEGGPPSQEEVQAATAAEGRFTFEVEEGLYRLHVEAKGYEPRPDETVEVQARKPLELRLLLQTVNTALRKEVAALRAAWQEQHDKEAEPPPEQQEVLAVLAELEQAVQAGDAEHALCLFSEDGFQRVDLGGDVEKALRLFLEDHSRLRNRGRKVDAPEPRDLTLVISADGYAAWRDTLRQAVAGRPQWSPGKQVLFTRQNAETTTLWLKDFQAEKQMTSQGRALHPTYSPDGQRIAYLFSPNPAADYSLWVMDVGAFPPVVERNPLDDTNKRQLLERVLPTPVAWSQDGQRIAFTDAEGRLATLEVATGAVQTLTNPPPFAFDVTPTWSSQSHLIAFVRETRAARTLWIVRADRPGEQPLTVGARFDEDPQFIGEGRLLYVTSPNGKEGDEGDWWLHTMTFAPSP